MNELPKRKNIRIKNYDYSAPGAYFITIYTAKREKIFWNNVVGADINGNRLYETMDFTPNR